MDRNQFNSIDLDGIHYYIIIIWPINQNQHIICIKIR